MDGPAWKRQRMDDGPGGPSRQDSVFYKTRMCHKCAFLPCWQEPSGLCASSWPGSEAYMNRLWKWHKGDLWTWLCGRRMHMSTSLHLKHVAGCIVWHS